MKQFAFGLALTVGCLTVESASAQTIYENYQIQGNSCTSITRIPVVHSGPELPRVAQVLVAPQYSKYGVNADERAIDVTCPVFLRYRPNQEYTFAYMLINGYNRSRPSDPKLSCTISGTDNSGVQVNSVTATLKDIAPQGQFDAKSMSPVGTSILYLTCHLPRKAESGNVSHLTWIFLQLGYPAR